MLLGFLAALGVGAGLTAGLFGVGGSFVLVPGLFFIFSALGYGSDTLMHSAVGTSLAIIIPTGLSSALAHRKKGALDFGLIRMLGPGIIIGVICGTLLADRLSGLMLQTIFAAGIGILALVMLINPSRFKLHDGLLPQPWTALVSVFNGTLSTLLGMGGGSVNVPYMTLCGVPITTAVGTASALGMLISIPAAIGFIAIGWDEPAQVPLSLGYVCVPAFLLIIPASVLCAPLGARLAHFLPTLVLKRVFAAYMILISLKMWHEVLGPGAAG